MTTFSSPSQKRKTRKKWAEQIRELAVEFLKGNGFGAGTDKILKEIRPSLNFKPTKDQVGQVLSQCDRVKKVGESGGRNGGATWILLEEYNN